MRKVKPPFVPVVVSH